MNTDYSAFCQATGRSSRCSASDNYSPYPRSEDPLPISWRTCSSPRPVPPGASPLSLADLAGRRGSVVLVRSSSYWATPCSRFRDKSRLPAFRVLVVFPPYVSRASRSPGTFVFQFKVRTHSLLRFQRNNISNVFQFFRFGVFRKNRRILGCINSADPLDFSVKFSS